MLSFKIALENLGGKRVFTEFLSSNHKYTPMHMTINSFSQKFHSHIMKYLKTFFKIQEGLNVNNSTWALELVRPEIQPHSWMFLEKLSSLYSVFFNYKIGLIKPLS